MGKIAYYPGSFDPLTFGHVDILRQAFIIADEIVVAIGVHSSKKPMLDFEERAELIQKVIGDMEFGRESNCKLRIETFDNLVVDAAANAGASILVRGVRDGTDLDYELQMSGMNDAMAPKIHTVFFAARPKYRSITSTLVRQIALMGGDVSPFVPEQVSNKLKQKFG